MLRRADSSGRLRSAIDEALKDEGARQALLHRLGTFQMHDTRCIDMVMPGARPIRGFEDVVWLLSSNYANRGMALLMLDEAAWLYRIINGLEGARVAELGRAKGGTTFLFAAAGAHVLSIDNGKLEAAERRRHGGLDVTYEEALRKALAAAGFDHRVELVAADAVDYSPPTASFDLVYHDIPLRLEAGLELFERWWPALRPGGRFILRDGREPRMPATVALADALRARNDLVLETGAPGVFEVIVAR